MRFPSWLRRLPTNRARLTPRCRTFRPHVEGLEDRIVPTAFVSDHYDSPYSYVITRPEAYNVFIGSAWNTNPTLQSMQQYLNGVVQDMVTSAFMDTMSEYYWDVGPVDPIHIGRGSFRGSTVMAVNASQPVTDPDLQDFLRQQIQQGGLPVPNDWQSVYMVFFAPGIQSQKLIDAQAGAYHGWTLLHTGRYTQQGAEIVRNVTYALMPSASAESQNTTVGSDGWKQTMTTLASHELAEAVTDPVVGHDWVDDRTYKDRNENPFHLEIADLCETENLETGLFHGYVVQAVWSQQAYARTGDGRVLPAGATLLSRQGNGRGDFNHVPGAGGAGAGYEDQVDLLEDIRPVSAQSTVATSTDPGVPLTVSNLFAGASSPTGQAGFALKADTSPAHGQVTYSASGNGSLTYTPDLGFIGADTFTYALTDGALDSLPVTVTVDISAAVTPPADLAEQNASTWVAWADGATATVTDDPTRKVAGQAALAFQTTGAFDTSVRYSVGTGRWDLTGFDHLHVAFFAENSNDYGFQNGSPWIRLIDSAGNYFQYQYYQGGNPFDVLNDAIGSWQAYDIPLVASGTTADGWRRTASGTPDLSRISTLEIHADTWGAGFSLWIDDLGFRTAAVSVSPASLPPGQVGTVYSQPITASGPAGPYTFTISSGSLPPGLTLSNSGALAGTPTAAGNFTFSVTAVNPSLVSGSQAYTLTIDDRPSPLPPPADLTEQNASQWIAWADGATATVQDDPDRKVAGQTALAFRTTGAFDTSVRYDVGPGHYWDLTGFDHLHVAFYAENPNVNRFQNGSPWVRLIDAAGNYFEYQYYLGGNPSDILNAAIGSWQSQDIPLNASGTVTDGWRRTASGAPDLSRITALEIHADTWDAGFSLWIDDLGFRSAPVSISPASLPPGQVGTVYSQPISASGPAGPYTFTVSSGSLPPGLTLSNSGVLAGTPTAAGSFTFSVTAVNPSLVSGSQAYTLTIAEADPIRPGQLQFSAPAYTAQETAGAAVVTVMRSGGSAWPVTVQYATADGSAHSGLNYRAVSGTLTFNVGETSKTFTVPVLDDQAFNGDLTVNLTLSSPTGGITLGNPATAVLTVTEMDPPRPGQLQFSAAAYHAAEDAGPVTITVTRSGGSDGAVSVQYATSDGTAVAGTNYTATFGTLTFGPGQTSQTFTVPVLDDQFVDGDHTVKLTLSQPGDGATLGSTATAVLTITEADVAGQVQFTAGSYRGHERGGAIPITVRRTGGSAGGVRVQYATADGAARAGTDYGTALGTLTFGPGQTSQTFTVTPLDNGLVTLAGLTVNLTLSQPGGGAVLGSAITAVLTVLDDDLPGVPDSPPPAHLIDAARAFAHSREHYTQFIVGAYQQYLKRLPDDSGLNFWVSSMQKGTYSDEQVEAFFLSSVEYIANHGGPGRGWIIGLYQDLLGRPPGQIQPLEVDNWVLILNGGKSAYEVALGFAASAEREGQRVRFNYQTYLGREARQDEVELWVGGFLNGLTNEEMVAGFVGSPEYYLSSQKGRNNEAGWVARAYLDVLFRAAGIGEVNSWLQQLGS
jgi:hypothetical protein